MQRGVVSVNVEKLIQSIVYNVLAQSLIITNVESNKVLTDEEIKEKLLVKSSNTGVIEYVEEYQEEAKDVFEMVSDIINMSLEDQKDTLNVEQESITEFMRVAGQSVPQIPVIPSKKTCDLRLELIREEYKELEIAVVEKDSIEILDALLDLQYVVGGAINAFGYGNIQKEAFNAVHSSNMSKFCTTEEEAEKTVKLYEEKGISSHYEVIVSKSSKFYIVYRSEDRKVLKSMNYTPVTEKLKYLVQNARTL